MTPAEVFVRLCGAENEIRGLPLAKLRDYFEGRLMAPLAGDTARELAQVEQFRPLIEAALEYQRTVEAIYLALRRDAATAKEAAKFELKEPAIALGGAETSNPSTS